MNQALLQIDNVDKIYGSGDGGVKAVNDLSMSVDQGEIVSLLGSSGCGKTSTLRMIAGFEAITEGSIHINGKLINQLPPVKRNVAMAFEGYSLYPPLTIRDNIGFALKATNLSKEAVSSKVNQICEMLEITDIQDRYPSSVSGGQQQRASLARALIRDADLHLLDEPMGQLEPQLRALLRGRIKHYIKEKGLTAILVTHDQAEANALSDRIAVMEGGYLQQFETPLALKEQPANLFTGTFIGEPPMNVFDVAVSTSNGTVQFDLGENTSLSYPVSDIPQPIIDAASSNRSLVFGVRPYAVKKSQAGISATVVANQWLGDQTHIAATLAGKPIVLVEHDRSFDKIGDKIGIKVDPQSIHLFDRDTGDAVTHGLELA
ncbi:MAG: ABC transporter ATP-binding protein [Granulosicoccus sp.]|nr:ABC transporter ATP-binding protein [Granulosicoccus sp.]